MVPSSFSECRDEIALFVDENVPEAVVKGLKKYDVDVVSVKERELLGADDHFLLESATEEGRVFVTQDKKDFSRLNKEINHSGTILVSRKMEIGDIIREIMKLVDMVSLNDIAGTVQWIPWK